MAIFKHTVVVRMYDTDAAGILYFANKFRFVHEAFEAFFEFIGHPIPDMVASSPYLAPTVHAEADYFKTIKAGDVLSVSVRVGKLGQTSMTLAFEMRGRDNDIFYGKAKMVYVFVSNDTREKCPVPEPIKEALEIYQSNL